MAGVELTANLRKKLEVATGAGPPHPKSQQAHLAVNVLQEVEAMSWLNGRRTDMLLCFCNIEEGDSFELDASDVILMLR